MINNGMIHSSITKEEVEQLPVVQFHGKIHVIETSEEMNLVLPILEKETFLGFDTETRPSFTKGQINKVTLLQLSTEKECFLFRLNKIDENQRLFDLLSNPKITKVGLSLDNDFLTLRRLRKFIPKGFEDLQSLVKPYGIDEMSLQKIYALLFREKISKGQRLSNWESSSLTSAQQSYAAIDAWSCLKIYFKIKTLEKK